MSNLTKKVTSMIAALAIVFTCAVSAFPAFAANEETVTLFKSSSDPDYIYSRYIVSQDGVQYGKAAGFNGHLGVPHGSDSAEYSLFLANNASSGYVIFKLRAKSGTVFDTLELVLNGRECMNAHPDFYCGPTINDCDELIYSPVSSTSGTDYNVVVTDKAQGLSEFYVAVRFSEAPCADWTSFYALSYIASYTENASAPEYEDYANYTDLAATYTAFQKLNLTDYTEASYNAAKEIADQVVFDLTSSSQSTVDGWNTSLSQAIANLVVYPYDYSVMLTDGSSFGPLADESMIVNMECSFLDSTRRNAIHATEPASGSSNSEGYVTYHYALSAGSFSRLGVKISSRSVNEGHATVRYSYDGIVFNNAAEIIQDHSNSPMTVYIPDSEGKVEVYIRLVQNASSCWDWGVIYSADLIYNLVTEDLNVDIFKPNAPTTDSGDITGTTLNPDCTSLLVSQDNVQMAVCRGWSGQDGRWANPNDVDAQAMYAADGNGGNAVFKLEAGNAKAFANLILTFNARICSNESATILGSTDDINYVQIFKADDDKNGVDFDVDVTEAAKGSNVYYIKIVFQNTGCPDWSAVYGISAKAKVANGVVITPSKKYSEVIFNSPTDNANGDCNLENIFDAVDSVEISGDTAVCPTQGLVGSTAGACVYKKITAEEGYSFDSFLVTTSGRLISGAQLTFGVADELCGPYDTDTMKHYNSEATSDDYAPLDFSLPIDLTDAAKGKSEFYLVIEFESTMCYDWAMLTAVAVAGKMVETQIDVTPVSSVTLNNTKFYIDRTTVLDATVAPDDATNKEIVWTVKNKGTTGAEIDGNNLTFTGEGEAVITATIVNGKASHVDYTKDFTINAEEFIPDGFIENGDKWNYYVNGEKQTATCKVDLADGYRFVEIDAESNVIRYTELRGLDVYLYNADQTPVVGFTDLDGKTVYTDASGKMTFGFATIGGNKYYFFTDGVNAGYMANAFTTINGKKYFFNSNGTMVTSAFKTVGSYVYYFGANGAAVTGAQTIANKRYIFSRSGVMYMNRVAKIGNYYYGFGTDGALLSGYKAVGGAKYYFNANGIAYTNKVIKVAAGKYYYFGANGAFSAVNGYKTVGSYRYFFTKGVANINKVIKVAAGKYYYFGANGALATAKNGLTRVGSNLYFFKKGVAVINKTFKVGKVTYKAASNGVCKVIKK